MWKTTNVTMMRMPRGGRDRHPDPRSVRDDEHDSDEQRDGVERQDVKASQGSGDFTNRQRSLQVSLPLDAPYRCRREIICTNKELTARGRLAHFLRLPEISSDSGGGGCSFDIGWETVNVANVVSQHLWLGWVPL